jgi:hypothetical protein
MLSPITTFAATALPKHNSCMYSKRYCKKKDAAPVSVSLLEVSGLTAETVLLLPERPGIDTHWSPLSS